MHFNSDFSLFTEVMVIYNNPAFLGLMIRFLIYLLIDFSLMNFWKFIVLHDNEVICPYYCKRYFWHKLRMASLSASFKCYVGIRRHLSLLSVSGFRLPESIFLVYRDLTFKIIYWNSPKNKELSCFYLLMSCFLRRWIK